jgi:hypothetical protein
MWLKQTDVDTWMAAISFYPAEKFAVFDDRYFVSYQRPYGKLPECSALHWKQVVSAVLFTR